MVSSSSDGETSSPVCQERGRKRSRYCSPCQKEVDATNWARHVRSNAHIESSNGRRRAGANRTQTSNLHGSLSPATTFSRRVSRAQPRDRSPPIIPLTEMRRCAAAVFSSSAKSYHGFYAAASRVFPSVPAAIRQAIAVTAELFAPVVRGAMASCERSGEPGNCSGSPQTHTDGPPKYCFERSRSCPPGLIPVAPRTRPSHFRRSPLTADPLHVVAGNTFREPPLALTSADSLSSVRSAPVPRASSAVCEPTLTDLLSVETSFNLDEGVDVHMIDGSQIDSGNKPKELPTVDPTQDVDSLFPSALLLTQPNLEYSACPNAPERTAIVVDPGLQCQAVASSVTTLHADAARENQMQGPSVECQLRDLSDSNSTSSEPPGHSVSRCDTNPKGQTVTVSASCLRGRELRLSLTRLSAETVESGHKVGQSTKTSAQQYQITNTTNERCMKKSGTHRSENQCKPPRIKRPKVEMKKRTPRGKLYLSSVERETAKWDGRHRMALAEQAKKRALIASKQLRELETKSSRAPSPSLDDELPTLDERIAALAASDQPLHIIGFPPPSSNSTPTAVGRTSVVTTPCASGSSPMRTESPSTTSCVSALKTPIPSLLDVVIPPRTGKRLPPPPPPRGCPVRSEVALASSCTLGVQQSRLTAVASPSYYPFLPWTSLTLPWAVSPYVGAPSHQQFVPAFVPPATPRGTPGWPTFQDLVAYGPESMDMNHVATSIVLHQQSTTQDTRPTKNSMTTTTSVG